MNFTSILKKAVDSFPGKPFIIENGHPVSYKEFWEIMTAITGRYEDAGIKRGDPVLIALPNSAGLLLCHFAAMNMAAISVPVKIDYRSHEYSLIIQNCRPKAVVSDGDWWQENSSLFEKNAPAIPYLSIGDLLGGSTGYDKKKAGICPVFNHETASINYSYSGDGYPKGATLTHGNHIYAATGYTRHMGFVPGDIFLITLPMQHVYALSGCINSSIIKGATNVIIYGLSPKSVFAAVETYKITVLSAVPALFELLARFKRKERYDISSLRRCVTGGDHMTKELQRTFEKLLNVQIIQGYGLTESLPIICNPHGKRNKPGTLGIPGRRDIEIKILDETHQEAGVDQMGEILIKSPTTMRGYYNLPEDTHHVLKDGWLYTGDYGSLDADGFLHFHGLKKNIFNIYGNNADPLEIQTILLAHPLIEKANITLENLSKDSIIGSKKIHADIYIKKDSTISRQEIVSYCREKIAAYKIPKNIEIYHT
jgi:long-chain acyl-CoA synthetase